MAYFIPYKTALITTTSASASGSIAFTSGINANYSTYLVRIRNALPASNAVNLLLTFSTDGGSTYLSTNYKYARLESDSNGENFVGGNAQASVILATNMRSTSQSINADIMLFDLNSSTISPRIYGITSYWRSDAGSFGTNFGGGMNTTTTAVNAIKFAFSAGNITSGTFTLYGVNETGITY